MTDFHSSDLHFDHGNIIDFCNRPYANTAEMNAALIANVNRVVGVNDRLFLHGDIAMGNREQSLTWMSGIVCQHIILCPPGNHDHVWPGGKKNHADFVPLYEQYMEIRYEEYPGAGIPHTMEDGTEVLLSHFPYQGDSHDTDRYSAWRPFDDGTPLLHGHVHDAWKIKRSNKGTLMINVGVDVWSYSPVSEHTLAAIIKGEQA